MKKIINRFFSQAALWLWVVAGIVAIVLSAGYALKKVDCWLADDSSYSESARCGPHHHWVEIGAAETLDRSCEMDKEYACKLEK